MWEGSGSKPADWSKTGFSQLVFSEGARKMDAPHTALQGQDMAAGGRLYMAFELGEKSWKLTR